MSRIFWLLSLILLLTLQSGCAGEIAPRRVQVTEQDNGKTVAIARRGSLEVTLEGNPTTGYVWVVEQVDASILSVQGDYQFKSDSTLIGSGGRLIYTFRAAERGETRLTLVYRRPWEQRSPSDKSFSITVNVR